MIDPRSGPSRRAFLAGGLAFVPLAGLTLALTGCGGGEDGEFGQKFEAPKGQAGETPAAPSKRRAEDIGEDREKAKSKAKGKSR